MQQVSSTRFFRAGLMFLAVALGIALLFRLLNTEAAGARPVGGSTVALLNIEGVITAASPSGGLFAVAGEASSVSVCEELYAIRDDPGIGAVVLRIDSPGGSAAGSDEIYRAIVSVREAGKPVVVSMGDIAASGGYYIASAADQIFANGATLTGSIGVIFQLINWEQAAGKLGIDDITLHAGEHKDIGSPWRPMSATEKQMLGELLNQVHEQFITAVDEGRTGLDRPQVEKLATGMIFTGEKARDVGLVDEVGGLEQAKARARELAKLPPDALVEAYGDGTFMDSLLGVEASHIGQNHLTGVLRSGAAGVMAELADNLFLSSTLRDLVLR
jgi:protease-4